MMVYEAATEWYGRYQRLIEMSDDFGGIPIDGSRPGRRKLKIVCTAKVPAYLLYFSQFHEMDSENC